MFKKFILALTLALALPLSAMAATSTITFKWTANPVVEGVTKYRIYQKSSLTGTYTFGSDANAVLVINGGTSTQGVLTAVADGTYWWTITAVDASGNESIPTADISVSIDTVAPGSPTNFIIFSVIKN